MSGSRTPRTVVFVGRRPGALKAAEALGLEVACVDQKPLRRGQRARVGAFFEQVFDAPAKAWEALAGRLEEHRPAAVFALTERAVLPAAYLRAALGLPGDSIETAARCTDKVLMKRAACAAGIPCARFVDADRGLSAEELVDELGLPLVVKARIGSGGRQTRICRRLDEVEPLAPGWMAESYVDGTEMSVETLVAGGRPIFVNATEYFQVRWANIVPAATLPPDERRRIEAFNERVLSALGVAGAWTHLELFRTSGEHVMSEIAARPPGGWITELIAAAYDFDPWRAWLLSGLGEEVEIPSSARRCAGVWLLHPGPGIVREVRGVAEARGLPGVERVVVRAEPGDVIRERVGAGQEVGHVIVRGDDRDQVARRLTAAREAISIELEPAQR